MKRKALYTRRLYRNKRAMPLKSQMCLTNLVCLLNTWRKNTQEDMENYFANETSSNKKKKKKRITGEELCLWRD